MDIWTPTSQCLKGMRFSPGCTSGSPPLQAEAVRAVLGLQPPPSASAACARRHLLVPRGAPQRTAAPLWRLALPHPPPKGQGGRHRLRPCHCFLSPPIPRTGALRGSAPRKVGRPPRASAGAASAWLRGRPFPSSAPRPPGAVPVLALQPQTPRGLRSLRAGPALPSAPRGRPGAKTPARPGGIIV